MKMEMNKLELMNNKMSFDEYLYFLYENKDKMQLSWNKIAEIMNDFGNKNYSSDRYRKYCKRAFVAKNSLYSVNDESSTDTQIFEDENNDISKNFATLKEIQRLKDERTQINAIYRQISREDYLKDIAIECAKIVAAEKPFLETLFLSKDYKYEGILLLSDWHYGISVNNHWNYYNPDVCKERLSKLLSEIVRFVEEYNLTKINVVNLGDLISGRIHSQIRIENKEDVISQVMSVSELLSNFLFCLSKNGKVSIDYYDCLDNHSRIEPDKKQSIRLESLARVITWYLEERFKNNSAINIHSNKYSDDIITFKCKNWNVAGVHGDLDSQKSVVKNLTFVTDEKLDLICTAHLHHFSCNEEGNCIVISNPSIMGVDQYAESKRFTSKPAQTLIIANDETPVYSIHRIVLD